MTDILLNYATTTWVLLNEAAPWVLLGFFVSALIKTFLSDQFIAKHLGKNGATSVLKASALGVPLPLCSCGVVPAAAGLRRQGASKGATAAFMISTPETGADSMAVTWAMLDPLMTVIRPLAAFVTATVAGLAINALDRDDPPTWEALAEPAQGMNSASGRDDPPIGEWPPQAAPLMVGPPGAGMAPQAIPGRDAPTPAPADGGCAAGCGGQAQPGPKAPLRQRLKEAFAETFGEMLQDIGLWLILGILLAGLISTFVPDDFFQSYLGNEWASLLVMLLVGIPLYICATASTPIAASMALKGLSPGAALVLLLAGPATNAATIAVATKILGKRATVIYVGSIALCALVMGWLVNRIYFALGLSVATWVRASQAEHVTGLSIVSSVLLLALIARPLLWRAKGAAHATGCGGGCGCSKPNPQAMKHVDAREFRIK